MDVSHVQRYVTLNRMLARYERPALAYAISGLVGERKWLFSVQEKNSKNRPERVSLGRYWPNWVVPTRTPGQPFTRYSQCADTHLSLKKQNDIDAM